MFRIAHKNSLDGNREGRWSSLLAGGTCFGMGIYFMMWGVFGLINQGNISLIAPYLPIPYPLGFYTLAFIPVIIVFIGLYAIKVRKEEKNSNKSSMDDDSKPINSIDLEVSRKAFHITIIGILVCYLFIGELAANTFFGYLSSGWDIWHININLMPEAVAAQVAGKGFSLFMIVAIFLLLTLTDFVRIYSPKYYPVKTISRVYREKEKNTLGPHVLIAVGVTFAVLFFSPPIAMAVIAMAALGDAAATIVGVTIGKHKIRPGKSNKTWEGSIAGIVVSYATGMLCMIVLAKPITLAIIGASLILCGVGVVIFFIIDYYTPGVPLTDNIMNPLCIGCAMTGLAYLFFPFLL